MKRKEMMDRDVREILVNGRVFNEQGDQMVDFTNQNRDSLDFTSLSRSHLQQLLNAAFRAGAEHASKYHLDSEAVRAVYRDR